MGNVRQLFSVRDDDYELQTALSEKGSYVAAGQKRGKISIFDESGEEEVVSTPSILPPSQLSISENDFYCYAGFSSDGLCGISADGTWFVPLDGLWAIDPVVESPGICAVSNPPEGPGTALYIEEGNERWRYELQESVGLDIAISSDGSKIAIGTGKYQDNDDPLNPKGVSGVYYYEWGKQQWMEETTEDVIGIMMDPNRGSIVAGTDDGSLISLNLDGDLLMRKDGIPVASKIEWEYSNQGGFISSSNDSTILASWIGNSVKAFDSYGNEKWRVTIDGMPAWGDWIEVNQDGSRVIAGTTEGYIYVIENGGIIWENYYEGKPVKGSISADGNTWCISIQDNDRRDVTIKVFREE